MQTQTSYPILPKQYRYRGRVLAVHALLGLMNCQLIYYRGVIIQRMDRASRMRFRVGLPGGKWSKLIPDPVWAVNLVDEIKASALPSPIH